MSVGYWNIRTYWAGAIGEKVKYWVGDNPPRRTARASRSDRQKVKQNLYAAEKRMARLLNMNFRPGDWLVELTYSPDGMNRLLEYIAKQKWGYIDADAAGQADMIGRAAERELTNAIRRVKREYDGRAVQLKYIAVTADKDGKTGEPARIHHHLVIPDDARDYFIKQWQDKGYGFIKARPLWDFDKQEDRLPIAQYLVRQARAVPDAKKYKCSLNLDKAICEDSRGRTAAMLRPPAGCSLIYMDEWEPGAPQYIRFFIPPSQRMGAARTIAKRSRE